jgi:hypothetical protein
MKRILHIIFFLALAWGCKKPYQPEAIQATHRFLVVDGVINVAGDARTTVTLSRTRNLSDTFLTSPETSASIQIQAQGGLSYPLQEQPGGIYVADHLSLNPSALYRLSIATSDGKKYLSDFVPVKNTPPIDSISWVQDKDLRLFVSTHDPSDKARYYRWDFVESWQTEAPLNTILGHADGFIFYVDSTNQTFDCWTHAPSTEILLSSSVKLAQDVIDHFPIQVIPEGSRKLSVRYSMLLHQYAITEDAFNYWQILQKNTQQLGTLFDAQPGQLNGNIHNTADATEPVIGYVSACNIPEKRIFIDNYVDLNNSWPRTFDHLECKLLVIGQNPVNYLIYDYPDPTMAPYYFASGGGLVLTRKECVDCRLDGATNQKPSFW